MDGAERAGGQPVAGPGGQDARHSGRARGRRSGASGAPSSSSGGTRAGRSLVRRPIPLPPRGRARQRLRGAHHPLAGRLGRRGARKGRRRGRGVRRVRRRHLPRGVRPDVPRWPTPRLGTARRSSPWSATAPCRRSPTSTASSPPDRNAGSEPAAASAVGREQLVDRREVVGEHRGVADERVQLGALGHLPGEVALGQRRARSPRPGSGDREATATTLPPSSPASTGARASSRTCGKTARSVASSARTKPSGGWSMRLTA